MDRGDDASFGRDPAAGASSVRKSEDVDLRMTVGLREPSPSFWASRVASKRSRGEPGLEPAGLVVADGAGEGAALTAGEYDCHVLCAGCAPAGVPMPAEAP